MDFEETLIDTTAAEAEAWLASQYLDTIRERLDGVDEGEASFFSMLTICASDLTEAATLVETYKTLHIVGLGVLRNAVGWRMEDDSWVLIGSDEEGRFSVGALPPASEFNEVTVPIHASNRTLQ